MNNLKKEKSSKKSSSKPKKVNSVKKRSVKQKRRSSKKSSAKPKRRSSKKSSAKPKRRSSKKRSAKPKRRSSKKRSAKPKRRSSKKRLVKQKKVNSVKKGAGFFDEKKLKEMFLKKSEKNGFFNKMIDKVADKIGIKAYTPPDITITPEMIEYQKLANVMYELILTKRIYSDEYNYNQEYQCVNNTENYTHQYREKCEELMNKVNEIVNEIDKEENTSEKIKNLSAMLEKYKLKK